MQYMTIDAEVVNCFLVKPPVFDPMTDMMMVKDVLEKDIIMQPARRRC